MMVANRAITNAHVQQEKGFAIMSLPWSTNCNTTKNLD